MATSLLPLVIKLMLVLFEDMGDVLDDNEDKEEFDAEVVAVNADV